MKVCIVIESYRDWDEGWDRIVSVHFNKEDADAVRDAKTKEATDAGDFKTDYEVEEHNIK